MALNAVHALKAKKTLPSTEAALQVALSTIPIGFFLFDGHRRAVWHGGQLIEQLGFESGSVADKSLDQLFRELPQIIATAERAFSGDPSGDVFSVRNTPYIVRASPVPEDAAVEFVSVVIFQSVSEMGLFDAEAYFEGLVEYVPEGIVTVSRDGAILRFNKRAEDILGYTADEVLGAPAVTILPDVSFDVPDPSTKNETVFQRRDGSSVTIVTSTFAAVLAGQPVVTAIISDISDRESAERALAESNARYALIATGANDGLWEWNLEDGTIQFSARWRNLLGLEGEAIKHTPEEWLSRIHPDDVDTFCDRFDSHLEGKTSQFEHEYRMKHANGEYRWVHARGVAARRENGEPFLMAGSQSDITDRKEAEESLTHRAMHDALTGLPNRGLVLDRIGQALARLERSEDHKFALAILDLDRFMVVNESLGHAAGDELLVSLARRLETRMVPGNTLARLGGDEFAVLLEEFESLDEVRANVLSLIDAISEPFHINGEEVFVSASFGVAVGDPGYKRAEELLRDADLAMYRAKKEGKSGFETFDKSRHRRAIDQLQVETRLRRALENDEILVHYQPIVDLEKGNIAGFEALARMADPERGIVPPGEFIGIAEETGLIVPLGERVLGRACRTAREWQCRFGLENELSISVNLSARHLAHENIVSVLENVLVDSALPPENLKLEITESLIMTNPELAAQTLARIKELGVTLSLDDFGTGYSSLSYLRRFPIDTLKMDRSFVGRMDTDERDMELVRMIILLAHTLGMEVIGEGIESESQVGMLRALDCEFGQGYFFARPLPPDDAAEMLSAPPDWR